MSQQPADDSISQNSENVNTQFSLSSDSNGNSLTPEQQKFFKDSKVRDDNGNVIPLSQRFDSSKVDIRNSLSGEGEKRTLGGSYRFDGKDL